MCSVRKQWVEDFRYVALVAIYASHVTPLGGDELGIGPIGSDQASVAPVGDYLPLVEHDHRNRPGAK